MGSGWRVLPDKRELLRRPVRDRKPLRLRLRLMLRDVSGVRINEDGGLSLLTKPGRDSFMRRVVWETGAASEVSSIGESSGTNSR